METINFRTVEALRKLALTHPPAYDLLCLVEVLVTKSKRERSEVDRRNLFEARHALAYARMDLDAAAQKS